VRLRELFLQEAEAPAKKLGRAFNHLEDLVFFHGSAGTIEALEHIKDIGKDASEIRGKWDGNPQIYWGREKKNGPLILGGHNGWSRGVKTSNPEQIYDFIVNKSGNPRNEQEEHERQEFGTRFSNLYDVFDAATPKNFVGFVYADGLFLSRPPVDKDGHYHFQPNPHSQTKYAVPANSELGQRIAQAEIMVVGHGSFPQWGMPDHAQQPVRSFAEFNGNPQLIVVDPMYNAVQPTVDVGEVNQVEQYLKHHAKQIDAFLVGGPGLSDLKDIIYTYVNQTSKARNLDALGGNHFHQWLAASKVSKGKQAGILKLVAANPNALEAIFNLVNMVMTLKDNVLGQVMSQEQREILVVNDEGKVLYPNEKKQFGAVKLVPRRPIHTDAGTIPAWVPK
jgi:hypothetical protein